MTPTLRARAPLLVALVLALSDSTASWAQARPRLVHSIDVQIPSAPAPVRIAGKPRLAYELHITNFRSADVALTRVDVLDADRTTSLWAARDSALTALLGRPGARGDLADGRVIGPGMRAVMYLWLALDDSMPMPSRLRHRIEFDLIGPSGREHAVVEGGVSDVRDESPIVLGAPLRGGPWVAVYDPMMAGGHRTSIYAIDGKARIPARFAIDWIRLDDDATPARGDATRIANWHGYGAEVLAVADGIVAEASDDMPESPSISGGSRSPIPLEAASGNYVTLDLGGGRYAFYEHLAHGSVRVRPGERVTRGQVLGQLGNSGSSSAGPHLHFHVSDANAALAAEGLPYVFRSFEVVGAFDTIGAVASGVRWKPVAQGAGGRRAMELPAANTVIVFRPEVLGGSR